jgi:hypothetical protein
MQTPSRSCPQCRKVANWRIENCLALLALYRKAADSGEKKVARQIWKKCCDKRTARDHDARQSENIHLLCPRRFVGATLEPISFPFDLARP